MTRSTFHWTETALATWSTLALRIPMLMMPAPHGEVGRRESERMLSEKVEALRDGMSAAAAAWMRLSLAAAAGEMTTAKAMLDGWGRVMSAFTAPGVRTVRANARRLTAPHRRRR